MDESPPPFHAITIPEPIVGEKHSRSMCDALFEWVQIFVVVLMILVFLALGVGIVVGAVITVIKTNMSTGEAVGTIIGAIFLSLFCFICPILRECGDVVREARDVRVRV